MLFKPSISSSAVQVLRRARLAVVLAPVMLAGCYVVPVVPVERPIYRPYPAPYYGPYRGYWRSGQAELPATTDRADAQATTPDAAAGLHIEVASNAR